MKEQIIISGFGGQGVMLAGKLLSYTGMIEDLEVSWLPSYGPEMRGGTANCAVTLSDKKISSPYISKATSLIIMNEPSLKKFEPKLVEQGTLLVNSSLVETVSDREDIDAYYVPANELAREVGSNKVANIVMLGAFFKIKNILKKDSFIAAMEKNLSKKELMAANIAAFEKGYDYISNSVVDKK